MTREELLQRVSDVLLRSGVSDAEVLIRHLEDNLNGQSVFATPVNDDARRIARSLLLFVGSTHDGSDLWVDFRRDEEGWTRLMVEAMQRELSGNKFLRWVDFAWGDLVVHEGAASEVLELLSMPRVGGYVHWRGTTTRSPKITAIKHYREVTGAGLLTAKRVVERIMARAGITEDLIRGKPIAD